jgi:hypothetical protein
MANQLALYLTEQVHDEKVDDEEGADDEPDPVPSLVAKFELGSFVIDLGPLFFVK